MSDTEKRILDSAEGLIRSKGYSAISYQDISNEVGIRKASIHYYYPSKGDLAEAVVKRYRDEMRGMMHDSIASRGDDAWGLLDDYVAMYLVMETEPDQICLCGALAGEYPVLPRQAQIEVESFFEDNMVWLREILGKGQASGQFHKMQSADYLAGWVVATMQGSLIFGRATGHFERVKQANEMVRDVLKAA